MLIRRTLVPVTLALGLLSVGCSSARPPRAPDALADAGPCDDEPGCAASDSDLGDLEVVVPRKLASGVAATPR
ncbi:MAG: hypothetical protein FJ096_06105 [Deltaproteobacteria bacterium]|nr:hypothetical protein [Deltaproteobacteria bacterium]